VVEFVIEIVIKIGMEQSRLFHCTQFHCVARLAIFVLEFIFFRSSIVNVGMSQ